MDVWDGLVLSAVFAVAVFLIWLYWPEAEDERPVGEVVIFPPPVQRLAKAQRTATAAARVPSAPPSPVGPADVV